MTKMKNKKMPDGAADNLKEMGMAQIISIIRPDKKLIYIVAFPSQEAADNSWKSFGADPEWKAARAASEKDGKLVEKVERVFLHPTDYSPLK